MFQSHSPTPHGATERILKTNIAWGLSEFRLMLRISTIPIPSPHLLKETIYNKDARPNSVADEKP
jgi:hypothetical protein